jgi:hypothetical protein
MTLSILLATGADSAIFVFLSNHLVLVALTASIGWFYAGHQYLQKGNLVGAFLWQGIAVLVLIAFCVNLVLSASKSWFSFALAIAAIGVEIWLMKRWLGRERRRTRGQEIR